MFSQSNNRRRRKLSGDFQDWELLTRLRCAGDPLYAFGAKRELWIGTGGIAGRKYLKAITYPNYATLVDPLFADGGKRGLNFLSRLRALGNIIANLFRDLTR